MANGYGIDSINALGSDPMFLAALQAYNPNFMGAQQSQAAQTPQVVTTPQVTTTQTQALPKADYSEGSDSSTGMVLGLGAVAAGAATLIYAAKKGNGEGIIKGFKNIFNSTKGSVSDALKSNRAMKEFRFKAKDGSQIFVKDGKVVNIIQPATKTEIKGAKEINKLLKDKGINQADLLLSDITNIDVNKLKDAGIKLKFKEYSFTTQYGGKTILVENGKIAKINGTVSSDVAKELGGEDAYNNFMKNIIEIVEKGGTPKNKKHAITDLNVKSYEWSQNRITGTALKNKKGDYYLGNTITDSGVCKPLTDTERNAYLETHKELNTTVQSLIEKGHAEGVNVARNISFDPKGNKLYINKKGDIIGVELKDAIKDSAGNDVKVLKDGKDRTLLDSWLYNNPEAKEFAKKEFDSGLARDGSTFIAV